GVRRSVGLRERAGRRAGPGVARCTGGEVWRGPRRQLAWAELPAPVPVPVRSGRSLPARRARGSAESPEPARTAGDDRRHGGGGRAIRHRDALADPAGLPGRADRLVRRATGEGRRVFRARGGEAGEGVSGCAGEVPAAYTGQRLRHGCTWYGGP